MNQTLKQILSFVIGAAAGCGVTYLMMRSKCDQEIAEEVGAAKEHYDALKGDLEALAAKYTSEPVEEIKTPENGQILTQAASYATTFIEPEQKGVETTESIIKNCKSNRKKYVITPEQFQNEKPYYDKITITYYAGDRTLVDAMDEVMSIEETLGRDALSHFGEYEDDVVYVRNDKEEIDYEVIRDKMSFEDYLNDT